MKDFLFMLGLGLSFFMAGAVSAFIKARWNKTPISTTAEFIHYHRHLKKPVIWSFIVTLVLYFALGLSVNPDTVEVAQKSVIAGLYASAGIYVFMLWGANLIRGVS